jgi:hypothetical protein
LFMTCFKICLKNVLYIHNTYFVVCIQNEIAVLELTAGHETNFVKSKSYKLMNAAICQNFKAYTAKEVQLCRGYRRIALL